jgi:hypothetical protein
MEDMKNIERYYQARRFRTDGLTLKEIGIKMGLSATRVREMIIRINKIEQREKYEKEHPESIPWYRPLNDRAKTELNRHGLYHKRKEDFLIWGADKFEMYHGQVISPKAVKNVNGWPPYRTGEKLSLFTLNQLRAVLGFPQYIPPIRKPTQKEIARAIRVLEAAGYAVIKP